MKVSLLVLVGTDGPKRSRLNRKLTCGVGRSRCDRPACRFRSTFPACLRSVPTARGGPVRARYQAARQALQIQWKTPYFSEMRKQLRLAANVSPAKVAHVAQPRGPAL